MQSLCFLQQRILVILLQSFLLLFKMLQLQKFSSVQTSLHMWGVVLDLTVLRYSVKETVSRFWSQTKQFPIFRGKITEVGIGEFENSVTF